MTKGKELTDYQKGQIEGREGSMTHEEIADEWGVPCRTVFNFLQRLAERGSMKNIPCPDKP
jgi:hypothetical protein